MSVFTVGIQIVLLALIAIGRAELASPANRTFPIPVARATIKPSSYSCILWSDPFIKRDDYTYAPGVGYYKLHTRAVVWNEARLTCEDEGGHLAVINSKAEAKAIARLFKKAGTIVGSSDPNYASIGYHELYSKGQYVTIHGESLGRAGYSAWAAGQPDNKGGLENCGSVQKKDALLNDIRCDLPYGFICEIPYK